MRLTATMSEEELRAELAAIDVEAHPLYERCATFTEAEVVGPGKQYNPAKVVRDVYALLRPLEKRAELLRLAIKGYEQQRSNDAMWERKAKRIAEAPVHQRRNGWEIVKDAPNYVLRDPSTKEEVYTGCLRRCREVADESKPEV